MKLKDLFKRKKHEKYKIDIPITFDTVSNPGYRDAWLPTNYKKYINRKNKIKKILDKI